VVLATKVGWVSKAAFAGTLSRAWIMRAVEASLQRLGTDYIDLYQLHVGEVSLEQAAEVAATLEDLRREGLIRAYGWSTDTPACALRWTGRPGCVAVQHGMNLFDDRPEMVALAANQGWASIDRSPLAMGMLSGKFTGASRLAASDVRGAGHAWVPYFADGRPRPEFLAQLDAVREILTSGGRTLAQGALAWLWARGAHTIPIPGFKTERQVTENAGAMAFGPLATAQMLEIDTILGRPVRGAGLGG
jgi:aryl-alcohol dehydrogenase-like predicted oxidoreductase